MASVTSWQSGSEQVAFQPDGREPGPVAVADRCIQQSPESPARGAERGPLMALLGEQDTADSFVLPGATVLLG